MKSLALFFMMFIISSAIPISQNEANAISLEPEPQPEPPVCPKGSMREDLFPCTAFCYKDGTGKFVFHAKGTPCHVSCAYYSHLRASN
jgi:hypothetical protein